MGRHRRARHSDATQQQNKTERSGGRTLTRFIVPTSEQSVGFLNFRRKGAVVVFVLGLVFLGTTGVQFVIDGESRGETGFFLGLLMVGVGIHQWFRLRTGDRSR